MKILVCSCDANADLFYPFHHCLEKYWKNHPEVIYSTESIDNPYYRTIKRNYPLSSWSKRIRETLEEMDDRCVLVMVDDVFIRKEVDLKRIQEAEESLRGNIALINFEKAFDQTYDIGKGFGLRVAGASFAVSIMCGLWDREKLIDILSEDMTPWQVEERQPTKGYDFCINTGDYIIDWGYRNFQYFGVHGGKWCWEVVPFFLEERIDIDLTLRGLQ